MDVCSGVIKGIDKQGRVLLKDVYYNREYIRCHCWCNTSFKSNKINSTVYFFAKKYSYMGRTDSGYEDKVSVIALSDMEGIKQMSNNISKIQVSRRESSVTIRFNSVKVEPLEEAVLDVLEEASKRLKDIGVVETNTFIQDYTLIVVLSCKDPHIANDVKKLYMNIISNAGDNYGILALKFPFDSKSNLSKKEVAQLKGKNTEDRQEDINVILKYPKSARVLKQFKDITQIVIDDRYSITKELIESTSMDSKEIKVNKVVKDGKTSYFCLDSGISIPNEIVREIRTKIMATYVTKSIMDISNFIGIEDGMIKSCIDGKDILVDPAIVKKHDIMFEAIKEGDSYYEIGDIARTTPIPVEVLNMKTIRVTE